MNHVATIALAILCLGLSGFGGFTQASEAKLDPVAKDACIRACNDCLRACRECLIHGGCPGCHKACLTCLETCRACVALMEYDSPLAREMCEICEEACLQCATACEACGDMPHSKTCAAACRACAAACKAVAE
ncbi:MAG: four-helix bundle copper-binding protein [Planctomycetota bacterium]